MCREDFLIFVISSYAIQDLRIIYHVTGPRQYSQYLEQGGLEVPCDFQFYLEDQKYVKKSIELLKKASYTIKDIKTHFQAEVSSTTVIISSSSVKVIDCVKNGNDDKPTAVKLPLSNQVIYEEDAMKENIVPKNS